MTQTSQPGFFISFEGSEGCGKSTQIRMLEETLRAEGREVLAVREPGGTKIGESLRHLLQHADEGNGMAPETELLLFAASRAQLVRQVIQPALEAGQVVISDRFLDSTTVYQGVARAIAAEKVTAINDFATGGLRPHITFLLDMDTATALDRLTKRSGGPRDRMEEEPLAFYEAVRNGYLTLASQYPERIKVLDASLSPAEIARQIRAQLHLKSHALPEGNCP